MEREQQEGKDQRRDPRSEKDRDYKHQRTPSEGGQGWRKTRARLPRMERRLYRHAQERAMREALASGEDGELSASDYVNALKRKHFKLLYSRREIPLGKKVELHHGGVRRIMYWVDAGRKQGRKYLPFRTMVAWLVRKEVERRGE